MLELKHQWATFRKGRVKVKACACCGDLHLPSNSEQNCRDTNVLDSQIVKAGYRLYGGHATLYNDNDVITPNNPAYSDNALDKILAAG